MKLVYDVGVHNGDDGAYYLDRACRVVGIEANPLLTAVLQDRFASAVREGRYVLLPIGVAEVEGEALFWVCDDNPAVTRGVTRDGHWRFPPSSSGPFGEFTPGPWRSHAYVLQLWKRLHEAHMRAKG